jgi:hypothetical protein
MVNLMLDSTSSMLRTWESRVENEGGVSDIKIDEDLRSLSADILSRACFGSDYTYPRGRNILKTRNPSKNHVQLKYGSSRL